MSGFESAFDAIAKIAIDKIKQNENDWYTEDNILICGVCGHPKMKWMMLGDHRTLIPNDCQCMKEQRMKEEEKEKEQEREKRIAELRSRSGIPAKYQSVSFGDSNADPENERSVKLCRRYLEKFSEMEKKNQGLLMYGERGTGKTHYASCIGNGVIELGKSVLFVSLPKLLQSHKALKSDEAEEQFLSRVEHTRLLIIDDFGAERGTDYALEFVYSVIDRRYCSGRPMVITTNLSLNEMQDCDDIRYGRVFDRLFEVCYPLQFKGTSKRVLEAAERFDEMRSLLED